MTHIIGKGNISAKIIADSISENAVRITTFELEYPRFIHSELMTHRLFSRNAASSRAIPVSRMIELVKENTAMPIHWGKNQPGMSAREEVSELIAAGAKEHWKQAMEHAVHLAASMHSLGVHKQIVNRLLEPFQFIKVVLTATEFDNFFNLRLHPDAQPEIQELARVMFDCQRVSEPMPLRYGEWHVPYYANGCWNEYKENTLEEALAISASCCAQISYRRLDDSLDKAQDIFDKLIETKPAHASPMEHQATPMNDEFGEVWNCHGSRSEDGVTHNTINGAGWSGNFKGWIQHRQLLKDHTCWEFKKEG